MITDLLFSKISKLPNDLFHHHPFWQIHFIEFQTPSYLPSYHYLLNLIPLHWHLLFSHGDWTLRFNENCGEKFYQSSTLTQYGKNYACYSVLPFPLNISVQYINLLTRKFYPNQFYSLLVSNISFFDIFLLIMVNIETSIVSSTHTFYYCSRLFFLQLRKNLFCFHKIHWSAFNKFQYFISSRSGTQ